MVLPDSQNIRVRSGVCAGWPLAKDALCCKSRYCGIGHAGVFTIDRGLKFNPDGLDFAAKKAFAPVSIKLVLLRETVCPVRALAL